MVFIVVFKFENNMSSVCVEMSSVSLFERMVFNGIYLFYEEESD